MKSFGMPQMEISTIYMKPSIGIKIHLKMIPSFKTQDLTNGKYDEWCIKVMKLDYPFRLIF